MIKTERTWVADVFLAACGIVAEALAMDSEEVRHQNASQVLTAIYQDRETGALQSNCTKAISCKSCAILWDCDASGREQISQGLNFVAFGMLPTCEVIAECKCNQQSVASKYQKIPHPTLLLPIASQAYYFQLVVLLDAVAMHMASGLTTTEEVNVISFDKRFKPFQGHICALQLFR